MEESEMILELKKKLSKLTEFLLIPVRPEDVDDIQPSRKEPKRRANGAYNTCQHVYGSGEYCGRNCRGKFCFSHKNLKCHKEIKEEE